MSDRDGDRRAHLQEERTRLAAQLAALGHGPDARLQYDEGFADTGQVTAERGEADALAQELLANLADVDDALAKLDAGTYGRCERCTAEISDARLEAIPAARLCIECAAAARR